MTAGYPTAGQSHVRLKRTGWSVGEKGLRTAAGFVRLVSGTTGENVIETRDNSQAEAWRQTREQAQAMRMPERAARLSHGTAERSRNEPEKQLTL